MTNKTNIISINKTTVRVFCPVYFDVDSFLVLKENIEKELSQNVRSLNFTIIDDSAGEDQKIDTLREISNVTVITPPYNLGHQRAIVFGLRKTISHITEEIICTMDSDGEDQPEDLPRLIEVCQNTKKYTLAKRTKRRESLMFKTLYFFYKLFFKFLTGKIIQTGNYIVAQKHHLKKIINHPYFDLCYSSSFLAMRVPRELVPCERGSRYKGQSKMNFNSLIMHGIRMLMPFLDIIAIRSLIIFSIGFGSSLLFAVGIISIKLFTDLAIPGWASFLCAITLTFSFVALGNFLILFSTFTESQGAAQRGLTQDLSKKSHYKEAA